MKIYEREGIVIYDAIKVLIVIDKEISNGTHSKVSYRFYKTKTGRDAIRIMNGGNHTIEIDMFVQPPKHQFNLTNDNITIRVRGTIPFNLKIY
jgi:hypothetical protein